MGPVGLFHFIVSSRHESVFRIVTRGIELLEMEDSEDSYLSVCRFNFNLYLLVGVCFPRACTIRSSYGKALLTVYGLASEILTLLHMCTVISFLVLRATSLETLCVPTYATFVTSQAAYKFFYMSARRNAFQRFFDDWDRSFQGDPFLLEKRRLLQEERRSVRLLSTFLLVWMGVPIVIWGLIPFLPSVQAIKGRFTAVQGVYPYDFTPSPVFEITSVLGLHVAWSVVALSVTFDTFFYTLVSMQIVQFKHLKQSFARIFDAEGEVFDQRALLRTWIRHHAATRSLGRRLCQLYSPILAMQFASSTMLLCLGGFAVAAQALDFTILSLTAAYSVCTLTQLLLLCWFGDRLYTESESLTLEGFSKNWIAARSVHQELKFVFQASQKPLRISAVGVVPLSAETFVTIVYSAASYILVLLQLADKKNKAGMQ